MPPNELSARTEAAADKLAASPGERYRLRAQSDQRREEGSNVYTPGYIPPETPSGDDARAKRRAPSWWPLGGIETFLVTFAVAVFVLASFITAQGSSLLSRGQISLIALAPLVVVTLLLAWLDRWAPLKARYKVLAIAWGGGIAALLAMVVNTFLNEDFLLYSGSFELSAKLTAVVVAPLGEEVFKGLGVVVVLVVGRHYLHSVLSGVALAGLVGAGFAYVENLEYFWQAWQEGTTVFGMTVFARSVMSLFVHPMATSFTGLGVASALMRNAKPSGWAWRILAGYAAAVAVHALWNWLAFFGLMWLAFYFVIELPLFILWLTGLSIWSQRMAKTIQEGLQPYVETDWVTSAEVAVATTTAGRRYARRWAKGMGKPAPRLVRKFQRRLGYLGSDQQLMTRYGVTEQRLVNDREYLRDVQVLREELRLLEILRRTPSGGPEKP